MIRRHVLVLAVAAQLAFLGWMVGSAERTLARGERVVLAIDPFDPVDWISGRYLDVRVRAARVSHDKLTYDLGVAQGVAPEGSFDFLVGREVALELAESPTGFEARRVLAIEERPRSPWLRARVKAARAGEIELETGLEKYFIPGDAHDPSWLARQEGRRLALVVRVDRNGGAVTEDLLVDEVPFREWNAAQKK